MSQLDEKYEFIEESAARPVRWIETHASHLRGDFAGERIKLVPEYAEDIRQIFGWHYKESPKRRFRVVFWQAPKGNAKTTITAALSLYLFFGAREYAPQVINLASSRPQARILFDDVCQMIRQNPALEELCNIYHDNIKDPETNGLFRVMAAEPGGLHGYTPSAIIVDEIHAWGPNGRKMWDALIQALGKRGQKGNTLMIVITTPGYVGTFWEEVYEYALKVKNNELPVPDEGFLPIIHGAPQNADPFDPKVWAAANPLWDFMDQDDFAQQAMRAKQYPSFLASFKRLRLGMLVSSTEAYIGAEAWDKCIGPEVDFSEKRFTKEPSYLGMDLSSVRDLAALAQFFPDPKNEHHWARVWLWCPTSQVYGNSKFSKEYILYVENGEMKVVPGETQDFEEIEDMIDKLFLQYNIKDLTYDRKFAQEIIQRLIQKGVPCHPVGQTTAKINAATQELEKMVFDQKLYHEGTKVLRWMIDRMQVIEDADGAKRPVKDSEKGKIDGIMAIIFAIHGWLVDRPEPRKKVKASQIFKF